MRGPLHQWLGSGGYHVRAVSPIVRPVRRAVRDMLYRGNRVECPLCGRSFSSWVGNRPEGQCPYCDSQSRHRLLWFYLREILKAGPEPLRVLHFAPEFCTSRVLSGMAGVEYVTADLYEPEAMLKLDITDIDLPAASFDLILCSHVLEHIERDSLALRELRRIARPGGRIVIQVPQNLSAERTYEDWSIVAPEERERAFGQWDHVRVYGADFAERAIAAGLDVSVVRMYQALSEDQRSRYGVWDDRIYECTPKPAEVVVSPSVATESLTAADR